MKILIDSEVNDKTAAKVDELIRFFLGKLLPKNISEEITVDVEFEPRLDEIALVYVDHDDEYIRDPREFKLVIRNKRKEIEPTIAHECVHIKQFALNVLRNDVIVRMKAKNQIVREEVRVWNEQDWLPELDEDIDYDSPWEIEAYGREVGLVKQWEKHKRDKT